MQISQGISTTKLTNDTVVAIPVPESKSADAQEPVRVTTGNNGTRDAHAEDIDVAIAIDRFSTATGIELRPVNHRWAGLRSFAPDKIFVVCADPRQPNIFWLAGQGGYGVLSVPALATTFLTDAVLGEEYALISRVIDAVNPEYLIQN